MVSFTEMLKHELCVLIPTPGADICCFPNAIKSHSGTTHHSVSVSSPSLLFKENTLAVWTLKVLKGLYTFTFEVEMRPKGYKKGLTTSGNPGVQQSLECAVRSFIKGYILEIHHKHLHTDFKKIQTNTSLKAPLNPITLYIYICIASSTIFFIVSNYKQLDWGTIII